MKADTEKSYRYLKMASPVGELTISRTEKGISGVHWGTSGVGDESPSDPLLQAAKRQLEEYFCTLCYAAFDLRKRSLAIANSGLPYPIRRHDGKCRQIELPGVPLGSFPGTAYEELTFELAAGDIFVFCTDGIYEAIDHDEQEFGAERVMAIIDALANEPAQKIVDTIFEDVTKFRADGPPADDMTAVAIKITA